MNKVRPEGKRDYNAAQRAARKAQDDEYKLKSRPTYLLELAVFQGRLDATLLLRSLQMRLNPREVLRSLSYSSQPLCEVCEEHVATDIHHKKGRGMRRVTGELSLLNDTLLFLGVCRACHEKIEANSTWSLQMGYSLPRNYEEETNEPS